MVCYCAHVTSLPSRTRVLLLQHPRERRNGIGTARMAHLALPSSTLRVGTSFATDAVVAEALAAPSPAYLLFPGATATDVSTLAAREPVTLVVVDGTWWQARKLLKLNPRLVALPRVSFVPRRPSEYQIRRQPASFCVSTIEALAEVLRVLEPAGAPFERLLDPFRAMVARQQGFAAERRAHRHQGAQRRRRDARRPTLGERLAALWPRLVCVQGEANAWPARADVRSPAEIVHWTACRPATGQIHDVVVAPRRPLAPATPAHVALSAERLCAGVTAESWHRSWAAFARPDDVVVHWGRFHLDLAANDGLALPLRTVDLRAELSHELRRRVGVVDAGLAQLGAAALTLPVDGRAGRRLAALAGLAHALAGAG